MRTSLPSSIASVRSVRINKERVDINAESSQGNNGKNNNNNGGNRNNNNNGGGKKKNKNKNKNNNKGNNQRQIEVDDEAVARQVKETLARLTSKSQQEGC